MLPGWLGLQFAGFMADETVGDFSLPEDSTSLSSSMEITSLNFVEEI